MPICMPIRMPICMPIRMDPLREAGIEAGGALAGKSRPLSRVDLSTSRWGQAADAEVLVRSERLS